MFFLCVCGGKREGFKYLLVFKCWCSVFSDECCFLSTQNGCISASAGISLFFFSECPVVVRWYGKDFPEIKST